MKNNKDKKVPFSNPRWNQEMGAVPTGETFELTGEDKKYIEEQDKKWKEIVKELKKRRNNTQK